ncbi:MAG: dTDP-4-dehydrorhamnose reductase [Planctomycetaceae bacterium]|nr:dTDP-4-dehydrorhamnose reductase [Planctomycetaceae bacterium]
MKLLIPGANGQLGTDLIAANEQRATSLELIGLRRADLDVTDLDAIEAVLADRDFDALINCTSYHKTDEVEANGDQAVRINGHAVQKMAECCAAKGARFVHVSTDYVYGGYVPDRPLTETDAAAPINVYGATKLLGENLALLAQPDTLVMRVASLFGVAGASGKGGNFVETMIRFGREKGQLRVIDDQTMSPTATADIAEMILSGLEKEIEPGIYHAVNTGQATWYAFAKRIIEQAGVDATVTPIPHTEFPTAARRPEYSVLNNGKLVAAIGAIPAWEDALTRYLTAKGHVR